MFEVGEWIFGIEVVDDDYENAEISGYLFMAECGDYILCTAEYSHFTGDFDGQLSEMYEECMEDQSISVNMLRKELCFGFPNEAEAHLEKLRSEQN